MLVHIPLLSNGLIPPEMHREERQRERKRGGEERKRERDLLG